MEDLIKTFYVDWKLLIAQGINFAVVLAVLWFFAMKPLMKIMKTREEKISKGVSDAEKIEERMAQIEKDREKEVKKGRKEAQALISQAEKEGDAVRVQRLDKAQTETDKMVRDAERQIRAERELMVHDVKDELGGLVALALGRIASSTIDEKTHKKLIAETINELKGAKIKK